MNQLVQRYIKKRKERSEIMTLVRVGKLASDTLLVSSHICACESGRFKLGVHNSCLMHKAFDFRWKLVENYVAALVGALFIWLFVEGLVRNDTTKLGIALLTVAVAPFLVTFLDKKSSVSDQAD
jgi:hypothetical protein